MNTAECNCGHKATAVHIYGVYKIAGKPRNYPMNEVRLCNSCGHNLWARMKDIVAAQHAFYEVKPLAEDM